MAIKEGFCNHHEIVDFYKITTQTQNIKVCGIDCWRYEFDPDYGEGSYQTYHFEGLYIGIFDVILNRNIEIQGGVTENIFELSFLLSGEILIDIEGVDSAIAFEEQECYMLYLPKVAGVIKYNKRRPIKEIRFRMDRRFIEKHKIDESMDLYEVFNLIKEKTHFVFPITNEKQHLLTEIIEDQRSGLVKRLFLESQCLKLISLQLETIASKKNSYNGGILKKMVMVQHIIEEDLSRHNSLVELSRQIGVNQFVLKKEFKKCFGKTVFEYAIELKMKKAIKLLKYSKQPIYEISDTIGYKNPTHFTAAFKRFTGVTPKQYRQT